jgi:uncharacterized protein
VARPPRTIVVPELFLGLLSIGLAFVVVAHIFANVIHDVRHTNDTISITGSARKPISSNLVRWHLSVSGEASRPAAAARLQRGRSGAVVAFLRRAGVPAKAITPAVVQSEQIVVQLSKKRRRVSYRVSQGLEISTHDIDVVEGVAPHIGELLERGIDVSAQPLEYLSTELTEAKLGALEAATAEAHHRAEILVKGLGGKLGRMRSSSLGVYQITPRDSTDVSDYGINDTSSREKDVTAVVTATFTLER